MAIGRILDNEVVKEKIASLFIKTSRGLPDSNSLRLPSFDGVRRGYGLLSRVLSASCAKHM